MRKLSLFWVVLGASVAVFTAASGTLSAGELGWTSLAALLNRTPVDVHGPQACDQCDNEVCITRTPVKDCVKGKKRVYDCKIRNEYVAIPETRYRWVTRRVTEEIPCCYCKPTCTTEEVPHCYETEEWDEQSLGTCSGCGGVYCKHCKNNTENLPCKSCGKEPGETTVKVHYRSCVKEPYIVYRQVAQPVCVKKPRYEHVKVPITKYVCERCGGRGCGHCSDQGCGDQCGDQGCGDQCDYSGGEGASPGAAPLPPERLAGAIKLAYPKN